MIDESIFEGVVDFDAFGDRYRAIGTKIFQLQNGSYIYQFSVSTGTKEEIMRSVLHRITAEGWDGTP